jgi:membrane-associated phospholipid phosphatase
MKMWRSGGLVKFRFTPGQWVAIGLLFAGIVFMGWTWFALEPAPPRSQWPSYYPWNPVGGELLFADRGPDAKQTFVFKGWLDAKMPFVPLLSLPYITAVVIWIVVVPFLNALTSSFKRYLTTTVALIVSMALLDLGVWLYHTTVIRDVDPEGWFLGSLVQFIYDGDPLSMNGWPSGHCTWTTVCIVSLWRIRRAIPKTAWILMGWLMLVYPATVMLRQHYLIDVYTGILLGFATYWACMFVIERPRLVPRGEDRFPERKA